MSNQETETPITLGYVYMFECNEEEENFGPGDQLTVPVHRSGHVIAIKRQSEYGYWVKRLDDGEEFLAFDDELTQTTRERPEKRLAA